MRLVPHVRHGVGGRAVLRKQRLTPARGDNEHLVDGVLRDVSVPGIAPQKLHRAEGGTSPAFAIHQSLRVKHRFEPPHAKRLDRNREVLHLACHRGGTDPIPFLGSAPDFGIEVALVLEQHLPVRHAPQGREHGGATQVARTPVALGSLDSIEALARRLRATDIACGLGEFDQRVKEPLAMLASKREKAECLFERRDGTLRTIRTAPAQPAGPV